jgi:prophage regulatory protein
MASTKNLLPTDGLVRLSAILGPTGPVPVSKSTWWAGVKSGRYPQPVKLGPRITAWRVADIRALTDSPDACPASDCRAPTSGARHNG